MCKGKILSHLLSLIPSSSYDQIVYVGDGSNDFCPSSLLRDGDFVFAREGYPLEKKIKSEEKIPPFVYSWKTGEDMRRLFLEHLKV